MLRKIIVKLKTFFLCFLSGALLALPFNNGKLWHLSWFGFVPLFIALVNTSKVKAFFLSYFTGVIFWSLTIYWLIHVTLPGTILLILYLALYFGIFGLIISTLDSRLSTLEQLHLACVWVLLEYLRTYLLTGFPWALLGYSQYLNLPIIQISDITGAWGVSFLVMMVNIGLYFARSHKPNFLLPLFFIFLTLVYGYYNLYRQPATGNRQPIKISVIQANIPQELKWSPLSKDYIIGKYLDISKQASGDSPDLMIWPEASLPVVLEEEPIFFEKVINFVQEVKRPLLLGAVTKDIGQDVYYNSALLVLAGGEVLTKYDKLHLVPFGEYVPLRKILPFLETIAPIGDIERGKDYTVFTFPAKFSVLICFEDLFPQISRGFIKKGAVFLVNITNDAWYKKTPAAFQHFQASVFRAVENRVFLIRAANTGVSGFIGPDGRIISLVQDKAGRNIFIDGYDTQTIALTRKSFSFYTSVGDVFPVLCLLFVLYGIISKTITSNLVTGN